MTGNHWHPEGSGVFLETQDGRLDLAVVTWQEIAPCGCVAGVTIAATDELIVTAEQAGRHFASSSAEYDQDVERGYSWRAREHHKAVEELQLQCPHDPKWGVVPVPTPDGFVWAAVFDAVSRPRLTHLVSEVALENVEKRRYGNSTAPLCGGKAKFWWSTEWHATDGKVECKRCIAAAEKREAVPA